MADPTRPPGLPPLDIDTDIHTRNHVRHAITELLALIAGEDPMLEMHRGAPPSPQPETSDQALELLRASAHADFELRRQISRNQARWALDAVLRGASSTQVAEALGVSPGAVGKRWRRLGKMRRAYLWFRAPRNAADWASACVALADVAASIRYRNPDDSVDSYPAPDISSLVKISKEYLATATQHDTDIVSPEWYTLVQDTQLTVEKLVNPRMTKALTEDATAALDRVRLVWRAYRAGITVEDQSQRDAHHHRTDHQIDTASSRKD